MTSYLVLVRGCGSRIWYVFNFACLLYYFYLGWKGYRRNFERAWLTHEQGPEDLFETISQALLNAVDRDALSGWGAHVYIIEKDKVTKRLLKGRQD